MMLNSPALADADLSSLRILFTGGEAVPYERALEFEQRTGAAVLQFYGSNETGAVSGTALGDPRERRLRSAGLPRGDRVGSSHRARRRDVLPALCQRDSGSVGRV